jgi:hypothetical protein
MTNGGAGLQMLRAFEEIYRVLKPGRKLCLFFTGKATGSFQEYVDLCQQAGFEVIDVRSLPEALRFLAEHRQQATYLTTCGSPCVYRCANDSGQRKPPVSSMPLPSEDHTDRGWLTMQMDQNLDARHTETHTG